MKITIFIFLILKLMLKPKNGRVLLNTHILIFLLLVFFSPFICIAQNKYDAVEIDSLAEKTYPELKNIFYNNLENTTLAEKIARYTLNKGIKEKVYKAVANSYIRLHYVFEDDTTLAEKYIDSSIVVCKTYKLGELLAESYYFKGGLQYKTGEYNSSLNYYLQSRDYYHEIKDIESYYMLHNCVGILKLRIQDNEDALNIFKDCLAFEEESIKKEDTIMPYSYINTVRSLAIAYAANGKIDSTSFYNIKGYKLAKLHPKYNELSFTHLEGGNQFLKGNYKAAEDSLIKSLPYLKKLNSKDNLAIAYSHLGRIYKKFNELEKSVFYFKKTDSIYTTTKYLIAEPREIYINLINYYRNKKDLKQQLYYTEQLIKIDNVLTKDYTVLSNTFNEHDITSLTKEKERLTTLLNNDKNKHKKSIVFFTIALSFLLLFFIYFYSKKINNDKKFNRIINELKAKNKKPNVISSQNPKKILLTIDQQLIDSVLEELNIFENNKDYLKPKITLNKLAKQLNTNSKYLSQIINKFKSKTFSNYINDLRIEYVVDVLQGNNSQLKNYTIKAIAQEVGFTSTESFTKAFYKKNGLTVSYFIKKIKK